MNIIKRNGDIKPYDIVKIKNAIINAMKDTVKGVDEPLATSTTKMVHEIINKTNLESVNVEFIQDIVEEVLMTTERKDVAKAYILYRENAKKRRLLQKEGLLSSEFLSQYKNRKPPMTELGEVVYYRTYSRYIPELGRREEWWETCKRAVEYNCSITETGIKEAEQLFDNMFNLRQFLSGRTLWVGGTDVSTNFPMANFNCAFQTMGDLDSFSDLLYLLLLGSGVGVRVLKEDVEQLPYFRKNYKLIHNYYTPTPKKDRVDHTSLTFTNNIATIKVGDSKSGWVDALKYYFSLLTSPQFKDVEIITVDYDDVRPMGEKLKTFGGRASGHEALKNILVKIDKLFQKKDKQRFKLTTLDCLDIANIIGEGVVVGGTRRTAEIILFDPDDDSCIKAKSDLYQQVGGKWEVNKDIIHRQMSNNSIYYKKKPTREKLKWQLEQMRYSGEPAWINEEAGLKRRENFKGVNPCAEILLDDRGMCNLTTINVMAFVDEHGLDLIALRQAQTLSVRAGIRMSMVEFELAKWNTIQKRDRLIGCSLTGWQDMVNACGYNKTDEAELLRYLRESAHVVAEMYSQDLGINKPLLITTVKPEGTLSQLPTVSSGVHHSHSEYYIRRIRINSTDPVLKVCEELGYNVVPEVGQDPNTCTTKVVSFPVKAPDGKYKNDVSAIEQLENYVLFMENYVDHNCSITVHVKDHEWEEVEQWVWDNWDRIVAVSFIPYNDSFYQLMPYESITEEQYTELKNKTRPFVPALITKFERLDGDLETEFLDSDCDSGVCPIR